MWAKRRKEIARIEKAWKAGHIVVGDEGEAEQKDSGSSSEEDGEVQHRRSLRQPGPGEPGGSSGGDGGLAAPRGEGTTRRLPRREGRALLQDDDSSVSEAEAAEAAEEGDEREAALRAMPPILQRVRRGRGGWQGGCWEPQQGGALHGDTHVCRGHTPMQGTHIYADIYAGDTYLPAASVPVVSLAPSQHPMLTCAAERRVCAGGPPPRSHLHVPQLLLPRRAQRARHSALHPGKVQRHAEGDHV